MARLAAFWAVCVLLATFSPLARSASVSKLVDFSESSGAVPLASQPDTRLEIFSPKFDSTASGNTSDSFGCAAYPASEAAAAKGKIVMVGRGKCTFQTKADFAAAAGAKAVVIVNSVPGLFGLLVEASIPVFLVDPTTLGDFWGNITARTSGRTYFGSYGPSFGYTGTPRLGELAFGLGTIDMTTLPTNGGAVSLKTKNTNSFKYYASWAILENAGPSDRPYLWLINHDNSRNVTIYDVTDPSNLVKKAEFTPTVNAWLSFGEVQVRKISSGGSARYYLYANDGVSAMWHIFDVTALPNSEPTPVTSSNVTIENLGFEPTDSFVYTANGTLDGLDANQIVVWTNNPLVNTGTPLKTFIETDAFPGDGTTPGAEMNWLTANDDQSLLFIAWGADGVTGYKILPADPYLQKFNTVYKKVGTADYTIGAQLAYYAKLSPTLFVASFINDEAVLTTYRINPLDGSLIGAGIDTKYPDCSTTPFPTACTNAGYPVVYSFVFQGKEYVIVENGRGLEIFLLAADSTLTKQASLQTRCDQVGAVGILNGQLLLSHLGSPACTCPTLAGGCPLQFQIEEVTGGTKSPASTILLGWSLLALLALVTLLF